MSVKLIATTSLFATVLFSIPSFAMKGIDAARACEARACCNVTYIPDGSILIKACDGREVYCDGPQKECSMLGKETTPPTVEPGKTRPPVTAKPQSGVKQ